MNTEFKGPTGWVRKIYERTKTNPEIFQNSTNKQKILSAFIKMGKGNKSTLKERESMWYQMLYRK